MAETLQATTPLPTPGEAPSANTRKMMTVLSGVAALSGLLIVGIFQLTAPYIDANREAMVEAAIFTVVPEGTQKKAYGFTENGIDPDPTGAGFGERFYAVYDDAGALRGVALEASGQGYQDVIRILYGYDGVRQIVTGMTVLESKETPGLGDKIAKAPAFLANFDALEAAVGGETDVLSHGIVVVKHGKKTNPWEIDGIAGATISSKAIGAMLEASLRAKLPRLRLHLAELEGAGS